MRVIRCRNTRLDDSGKEIQCGRVLAAIPDWMPGAMKAFQADEDCLTLRCPSCPPDSRFIRVRATGDDLAFETMAQHPDLGDDLEITRLSICSQAA
jgi:hypothetical protein